MTLSAIPYTVIFLAIAGMLMIVLGAVVQEMVNVDNGLVEDTTLPYSPTRAWAIGILVICFNAMGFVALITAAIFLTMNGLQSQSGEI